VQDLKNFHKVLAIGLLASLVASAAHAAPDEGKCVTLTRGFWIDVFGKKNADAAAKYITENYIQHSAPPQPDGKHWIETWRGVYANPPYGVGVDFPEGSKDFNTEIVSLVGDDTFAVLEAHDTGTYDHGVNVGKTIDSHYWDIFRCENGRVVEHWFSPG